MKSIKLFIAIFFFGFSQISFASMKITVNGMVCSFCAQGIEKSIMKMEDAKAIFVDLKNKVVVIEAKEGKTLSEKLISQEIKDSGYDVVKIETITQTVAQFKAESRENK